jgi:hypothetical protein
MVGVYGQTVPHSSKSETTSVQSGRLGSLHWYRSQDSTGLWQSRFMHRSDRFYEWDCGLRQQNWVVFSGSSFARTTRCLKYIDWMSGLN